MCTALSDETDDNDMEFKLRRGAKWSSIGAVELLVWQFSIEDFNR